MHPVSTHEATKIQAKILRTMCFPKSCVRPPWCEWFHTFCRLNRRLASVVTTQYFQFLTKQANIYRRVCNHLSTGRMNTDVYEEVGETGCLNCPAKTPLVEMRTLFSSSLQEPLTEWQSANTSVLLPRIRVIEFGADQIDVGGSGIGRQSLVMRRDAAINRLRPRQRSGPRPGRTSTPVAVATFGLSKASPVTGRFMHDRV